MMINSTPPITRWSTPVADPRERPTSPMDAHKAMKTALNPATKLIAFANAAGLDTCWRGLADQLPDERRDDRQEARRDEGRQTGQQGERDRDFHLSAQV